MMSASHCCRAPIWFNLLKQFVPDFRKIGSDNRHWQIVNSWANVSTVGWMKCLSGWLVRWEPWYLRHGLAGLQPSKLLKCWVSLVIQPHVYNIHAILVLSALLLLYALLARVEHLMKGMDPFQVEKLKQHKIVAICSFSITFFSSFYIRLKSNWIAFFSLSLIG